MEGSGYRLLLGDCLKRMAEIEDGSVDLILADLPYGSNGCSWDVVIPFEPLWVHYRRVLAWDGAILLTGSQPFTSLLITSNLAWFRYELIWEKGTGTNFQHANHQPLKTHENVAVFSPLPAVFTRSGRSMTYHPQKTARNPANLRPYSKAPGKLMRVRSGKCAPGKNYDPDSCFPVSVLHFDARAAECNAQNRLHPSQKPLAMYEYLIRTYSDPGSLVLDSCMGSGTTGEACLNTDRRFIGIEKDAAIFEIAERRLAKVAASLPLFSPSGGVA